MGCHFLLQGIFLTQASNLHLLGLLHWQEDSLSLSYQGATQCAIFSHFCLRGTELQTSWVGGRVHCNQQHVALQPAAQGSRVANRHQATLHSLQNKESSKQTSDGINSGVTYGCVWYMQNPE